METTERNIHAVFFSDGSTAGQNPGYGGAGVFGYTYKEAPKNKNYKHPIHNTLYFTPTGIFPVKSETNIEVLKIVEVVKAVINPSTTNNEAELIAFLAALNKAFQEENLKSFTIYTDSNYIVSSFNENMVRWIDNNWKRQDGRPIANREEWEMINSYKKHFIDIGVTANVVWVKGHSDSYCNNIADIYSVIGSNSAKRQGTNSVIETFKTDLLDLSLPYAEYKKSYLTKDIILFFRDMYFSSSPMDDSNYCFLSTSENQNTVGKRDTATIFASNVGYIPEIVSKIKNIFRKVDRDYVTTCCVKLNKLENKEIYRLTEYISLEYLLVKSVFNSRPSYSFIRDTSPFLFENGLEYPFIVNAVGLFSRMLDTVEDKDTSNQNKFTIDITNKIVSEGKIAFTNKDKIIDLSETVEGLVNFKQKLLLSIGYDIPSFLALKNMEAHIQKVELIIDCKTDSNFCTLYVNIDMGSRNLYTVNIENKFLRVR